MRSALSRALAFANARRALAEHAAQAETGADGPLRFSTFGCALPSIALGLALGSIGAPAWGQSAPTAPARVAAASTAGTATQTPASTQPSGAAAAAGTARAATSASTTHPAASVPGAAPFARGEVLHYNVNWPSGLSLGEAQFRVGGGEPGWGFAFSLDASLPGFDIKDDYHSSADAEFCSQRLEKDSVHGPRKSKETVTYDQETHKAERKTDKGGTSHLDIPACVKDGLTFFYYVRRELAGGRLPAAQTINFGSAYQITVTYRDARRMQIGDTLQTADRLEISIRGPASSHTFEALFARDAARTPLEIRVPFSLGSFSLELAR